MDSMNMSEKQTENLIQRSLSEFMASQPQRGGTFYAIQNRLNEQDKPSVKHRVSEFLETRIWRYIPVSRARMVQLATVAAVVVVVIAYFAFVGSDTDDENNVIADPTATVLPSPTSVPPTATTEPLTEVEATEIPVPTATAAPSSTSVPPTATTEPTTEVVATETPVPTATSAPISYKIDSMPSFTPVSGLEKRDVPDALAASSQELPVDEVAGNWEKYIGDSRMGIFARPGLDSQGDYDLVMCSTGRGVVIRNPQDGTQYAEPFDWAMLAPSASSEIWNTSVIQIALDNPGILIDSLGASPAGQAQSFSLSVDAEGFQLSGSSGSFSGAIFEDSGIENYCTLPGLN